VLDMVGGQQLGDGGTLVSVGRVAHSGEIFPEGAIAGGPGREDRSLAVFHLLHVRGLHRDLSWLGEQVARGSLDPQITWRGGWADVPEAVSALLERRLHGKAVIDLR
jgi:NADPH:quinone reductase